ncbi:MAG: GNAT family N-acetyltransferase [Desulfobacteraceae bacterium]|nr:GNAT family N-acetyltransferase [Desulfobacteraceae bacterium]
MNIKLMPYTEIDGIRTISDSKIKKLFDRTICDGVAKTVFYEDTIQTNDQFLSAMKNEAVLFYLMIVDGEIVGYTWLNRFENHTARQHFCVFKDFWGKSIDLGKQVLSDLLHMKDKAGNFIFDLLTGFVPAWNERAIKFSLKCGGKTYGKIPKAIWNDKKQISEDAFFIYYTRGSK